MFVYNKNKNKKKAKLWILKGKNKKWSLKINMARLTKEEGKKKRESTKSEIVRVMRVKYDSRDLSFSF